MRACALSLALTPWLGAGPGRDTQSLRFGCWGGPGGLFTLCHVLLGTAVPRPNCYQLLELCLLNFCLQSG